MTFEPTVRYYRMKEYLVERTDKRIMSLAYCKVIKGLHFLVIGLLLKYELSYFLTSCWVPELL